MSKRTQRSLGLATCLVTMAMFSASQSYAGLADGLVNYWNFDNTLVDQAQGNPLAASTVADTGSFTGPAGDASYGPGLFGSAGTEYNGEAGWVTVTNSADTDFGGADLTISTWFRVDAFDTSWQGLIASGEGSDYRIARSGGGNQLAYAGGVGDITGGPAVDDGSWYNVVAITEQGVSTRLWINGALVATGGSPTLTSPVTDLFIGANPQAGSREFQGEIDDTAMWNRALTSAEIAALYDGGIAGSSLGDLIAPIPEPSTVLALFGLALAGVHAGRRRRKA